MEQGLPYIDGSKIIFRWTIAWIVFAIVFSWFLYLIG